MILSVSQSGIGAGSGSLSLEERRGKLSSNRGEAGTGRSVKMGRRIMLELFKEHIPFFARTQGNHLVKKGNHLYAHPALPWSNIPDS